jgi:hypothetical protein
MKPRGVRVPVANYAATTNLRRDILAKTNRASAMRVQHIRIALFIGDLKNCYPGGMDNLQFSFSISPKIVLALHLCVAVPAT